MPNSANKSNSGNSNAGQGAPKHQTTSGNTGSKPNHERSDVKHGGHEKNQKGDTSRSSSQGRKSSSGGSEND